MKKTKLLLATNNKHKVSEIQKIIDRIAPNAIKIMTAGDVCPIKIDVEETGATLEENALLKAKTFFDICGITTIADDTSLEIDALGGEPGIFSARYSGVHGSDAENRKKVLRKLQGIPDEKRTARFRTVICLFDGIEEQYIDGVCNGRIIGTERGESGFGYDPIFIPDGYETTFAEMTDDEKNRISHRAKAIENLVEYLEKNEKR
jgi:XTP/dITP diphosphohydrolase